MTHIDVVSLKYLVKKNNKAFIRR